MTTYTSTIKPTTAYTEVVKNATAMVSFAEVAGIRLDSTAIKLESLAIRLNGFTTEYNPNRLNNKPTTEYTNG